MNEEQWIDWHPKMGDVRPEKYRWKKKSQDKWSEGTNPKIPIDECDLRLNDYQIPAPAESQEDRPPWIDPQCKFRWGDRVKDSKGIVLFVINPDDRSVPREGMDGYTVLVGVKLSTAVPYATKEQLMANGIWQREPVDRMRPEDLELFPEELPPHFDPDRVKPVVSVPARKPREIWVNLYGDRLSDCNHKTRESAKEGASTGREVVQVLFREVFPEEHNPLTNMQYSPGG